MPILNQIPALFESRQPENHRKVAIGRWPMKEHIAEMTNEELDEIEQRCQRATAGPWKSFIEGRDHTSGDSFIMTAGDDIYLLGATQADQDFIAAARQDIPALIAQIRQLQSKPRNSDS